MLELHLRLLAPDLPRRPWSAAYGLGPSVFTIRAERWGTDRASVSQPVACRGAPPLPARSLGPSRCCLRTKFARRIGCLREGEGSWAWTRRNLVCGSEGFRTGAERRWGWPACGPVNSLGAEVWGSARPTRGIVPAGKPRSPSPSELGHHERPGARGRTCSSFLLWSSVGEKCGSLTLRSRIVSFERRESEKGAK